MKIEPISVLITVNSPGEVSGWLKPAVKAIKNLLPEAIITVFIPPCRFASGAEAAVIKSISEIEQVISPRDFVKYVFWGKVPAGFSPTPKGVVLFLGGDLAHGALLAKRLKYPALAYTEGRANFSKRYTYFAQPYASMGEKLIKQGIPPAQVKVIGNLMLDAVEANLSRQEVREKLQIGDQPLVLLMPGSRPFHLEMVPFLLAAVSRIKDLMPEAALVLSISPFISDAQLAAVLKNKSLGKYGKKGKYITNITSTPAQADFNNPGLIETEDGIRLPALRGHQYDLMKAADVAIALPGTNSVELAYLGIPTIIVLPLIKPEKIPFDGLIGLIGNIPLLGSIFKRLIVKIMSPRIKYLSWPNRLADAPIIPELRGKISGRDVGDQTLELIYNLQARQVMSNQLKQIVGKSGAALRLAKLLQETLKKGYAK